MRRFCAILIVALLLFSCKGPDGPSESQISGIADFSSYKAIGVGRQLPDRSAKTGDGNNPEMKIIGLDSSGKYKEILFRDKTGKEVVQSLGIVSWVAFDDYVFFQFGVDSNGQIKYDSLVYDESDASVSCPFALKIKTGRIYRIDGFSRFVIGECDKYGGFKPGIDVYGDKFAVAVPHDAGGTGLGEFRTEIWTMDFSSETVTLLKVGPDSVSDWDGCRIDRHGNVYSGDCVHVIPASGPDRGMLLNLKDQINEDKREHYCGIKGMNGLVYYYEPVWYDEDLNVYCVSENGVLEICNMAVDGLNNMIPYAFRPLDFVIKKDGSSVWYHKEGAISEIITVTGSADGMTYDASSIGCTEKCSVIANGRLYGCRNGGLFCFDLQGIRTDIDTGCVVEKVFSDRIGGAFFQSAGTDDGPGVTYRIKKDNTFEEAIAGGDYWTDVRMIPV